MADEKPRGRPRRNAEFEQLLKTLPAVMEKRPKYLKGIGVFRGQRGDTVWIKIRLPHGATYKGKSYPSGSSLEIKAGSLASFSWDDLQALHTNYQRRADRGEPLEDAPVPTFEAWARDWLKRGENRLRAYETESIHVNRHLVPFFGGKTLAQITTQDVNRWIARELGERKPSTAKREFNTLRAIFNDAIRAGQTDSNPCTNATRIRGIVGRRRFLQGSEMVELLAKAETVADWLPDYILWAIHSGMRKGEIRALSWPHIRVLDGGRIVVVLPTSKADEPRIVPCTRTMVDVLERQKGRKKPDDDSVFPLTPVTLRRKWEKARDAAGLRDTTIQDLRRTHGTHAAAAGVDLRTLADRIGHTDLTMLQKHYAAVVGAAAVEAAETFQRTFDRLTSSTDNVATKRTRLIVESPPTAESIEQSVENIG